MNVEKAKGILIGILITTMSFGAAATVFATKGNQTITAAYNNIKIYVDQQLINPTDANGNSVEPFIYNGTTYLPVRAIANALGKNVDWDNPSKSVIIGARPATLPVQQAENDLSNGFSINTEFLSCFGKTYGEVESRYGKLTFEDMWSGAATFRDKTEKHSFHFWDQNPSGDDVCTGLECHIDVLFTNYNTQLSLDDFVTLLRKTNGISELEVYGEAYDEGGAKIWFKYGNEYFAIGEKMNEDGYIHTDDWISIFHVNM